MDNSQRNGLIYLMLFIMGFLFLANFASAVNLIETKTDYVKQGDVYIVKQYCVNSTYANISFINLASQNILGQTAMTEVSDDNYQYNFTNTSILGIYSLVSYCDENGVKIGGGQDFEVTSRGEKYGESQTGIIIAQGILIALFAGLGFSFSKEKWKLRGFFFILGMFMAVIMLNSIRILAGSSSTLDTMVSTGLIIGIIAVSFMAVYLLIHYTIELIKNFRSKREMKWQVSNTPN